MKKYKIIFDLDKTLVRSLNPHNKRFRGKPVMSVLPWLQHFKNHGLYLDLSTPYYIFPGVLELMRWLDSLPDVQLGFYSLGKESRNKELVKRLLEKALGEARYKEIEPTLLFRSREDGLVRPSQEETQLQQEIYGFDESPFKKDLRFMSDSLDNIILVDNELANCRLGQERNILSPTGVSDSDFLELYRCQLRNLKPSFFTHLRVNQVFYIAGMLKTIITFVDRNEAKNLADALFALQFRASPDHHDVVTFYDDNLNSTYFHEIGLAVLKPFGNDVCFIEKFDMTAAAVAEEDFVANPFTLFNSLLSEFRAGEAASEKDVMPLRPPAKP